MSGLSIILAVKSGESRSTLAGAAVPTVTATQVVTQQATSQASARGIPERPPMTEMPCDAGRWVVQLAVYSSTEPTKAAFKQADLTDLARRLKSDPDTVNASLVKDACANVSSKFAEDSGAIVLWSGLFEGGDAARGFCRRLGFRTDVVTQCFPHKLL